MLEYDALVGGLVGAGVPRERAEAQARRELRIPAVSEERDSAALEKEEQAEITKTFRAFGFVVRNLSQPRATKQAPGIPDLWVTHGTRPLAFWWETKRQVGGRFSPAQIDFARDCKRCGVGYGAGDRHAAAQHLVALGLVVITDGVLEPVTQRETADHHTTEV